jgi:hypothetical protein
MRSSIPNPAVHQRMRELSLRAPWRDVAAACDRMVEWLSFTLWVRTVIDTAQDIPSVVVQAIETRCPGFLQSRASNRDRTTLWQDLAAWVDHHHFATARDGGWLDAVHHYVGRDARSDAAWSLWETTAAEGSKRPPTEFTSFEDWHRMVLAMTSQNQERQHGVSEVRFQEGVARYLDWESLAFCNFRPPLAQRSTASCRDSGATSLPRGRTSSPIPPGSGMSC